MGFEKFALEQTENLYAKPNVNGGFLSARIKKTERKNL